MLPIVLVLLVASSAFAAPSVSVSNYGINEIAPTKDNGRLVSSYLTDNAFEVVDSGDSNIYILTIQQVLNDLANQEDSKSQALALAQTTAVLGEQVYSYPGDACVAASAIDSFVGKRGSQGVRSFLISLAQSIDAIASAALNPNALRYSTGPRSNCVGAGRTYQFEAAWDAILDQTSPYNVPLINEEYCSAKRLYNAFNARSNNVGAAVTASALPPVVASFERCTNKAANFYRAIASGRNASQAAAEFKACLLK